MEVVLRVSESMQRISSCGTVRAPLGPRSLRNRTVQALKGNASVPSKEGTMCESTFCDMSTGARNTFTVTDAKKYGPHTEHHFFKLRNMRRETDPIVPRHSSIESPLFLFPSLGWQTCVSLPEMTDHLCQRAFEGLPWPCGWP